MKYDISNVLRRGFENTFANWPLLLLRIAASIVMIGICLLSLVALLVPVAIWLGSSLWKPDSWRQVDPEQIVPMLIAHGVLIIGGLIFLLIVVTVVICIYAFVEAAMARIYYEGELAASAADVNGDGSTGRFRAFTAARFFAAGRAFWWRTLLVYNTIWGAAFGIVLIPLLAILALVYSAQGSPLALGVGCLMLAASMLLLLLLALGANAWATKSVLVVVATGARAGDAIRIAWRDFRLDVARHLLTVVLLLAISLVISSAISTMSMGSSIGAHAFNGPAVLALLFAPMRIVSQLFSSVVGAAISAIYTASFAALQNDRRVVPESDVERVRVSSSTPPASTPPPA